jgi:iron(III) transport system substrate-binding protein
MPSQKLTIGLALVMSVGLASCGQETSSPTEEITSPTEEILIPAGQVNIYSYRQETLIRPLLDAFTAETGITVNVVSGKADALLERLKNEGINSPADLLLTADVGRLLRAQEAGVLQPMDSELVTAVVPAAYRDPANVWVGLSLRARTIFYAKDRVDPASLSTMAALVDDAWKGEICVRNASNIYNQSMLSAMVARDGAEAAEAWAAGIVANMARRPQGGDRDQLRAVAADECDIAIANSYYYGRMMAEAPEHKDRIVAEAVGLFWSDQEGVGTHVNISGAALTKHAKNKAAAIQLVEFLLSETAQKIYAESVYEFPVREGVALSPIVEAWGPFKADDQNLSAIGAHSTEAVMMMDRVGWE